MDLAAYDALIAKLEKSATQSPSWYRTRVAALAMCGYLAVAVVLLIGMGSSAGALGIVFLGIKANTFNVLGLKFSIVLFLVGAGLIWSVMRGVWVRFPRVPGVLLRRREFPLLAEEVESLRRAVGSPRVHRIVITSEFNAALAQRPRLGLFGWYENQLVLGLPLLRQMTVAQARSVIAHELGHLRGEHGRFGARIYRLRVTWAYIAGHGTGGRIMHSFLTWYAPLFNAYSFVLARMQEREADRTAARVAGAEAAGSALVRCALAGRHSVGFWETLARQSWREAQAPDDLLDRLDRHFATMPEQASRWVGEELNRSNNRMDAHPCLRERLALIGRPDADRSADVLAAMIPDASAAHAWLATDAQAIATKLNADWVEQHRASWTQRHSQGTALIARHKELAARQVEGALAFPENWELVQLTHAFDGEDAAQPLLDELLSTKPDFAPAIYMRGSNLLRQGDARGVAFIENAMSKDGNAVPAGCQLLRDFADIQGKREVIDTIESRAEKRGESEAKARVERARVPVAGRLIPHGLDPAVLAPMLSCFALEPQIAWIDLAQVTVDHLPENPHFVLVVRINLRWWTMDRDHAAHKILIRLGPRIRLPGSFILVSQRGKSQPLAKRAAELADARIYTRMKSGRR